MFIQENISLKGYTTFRMGPTVRYFVVVTTVSELREVLTLAKAQNLPVVVLGGGSNIIVRDDKDMQCVVIKIEITGFEVFQDATQYSLVKIGAGEVWDKVVALSVERNLGGIEALSSIPGTAGATPIQNVGAYGQEIADTLVYLSAYEIATGTIREFTKEECLFGYRDSIFKHEAKDKYIILSIVLKLSKEKPKIPAYSGVQNYFETRSIKHPTLNEIREVVIGIRKSKLPDPKEIASVGSFFKNPFVSKKHSEKIQSKYPGAVMFPVNETTDKIAAGWLIDSLGLKGKEFGNLMIYENNALVIVNKGDATYKELNKLVSYVKDLVYEKFEISLEQEPITLG